MTLTQIAGLAAHIASIMVEQEDVGAAQTTNVVPMPRDRRSA